MSTQELEQSPSRRGGRRNAIPVGLEQVGKERWVSVFSLLAPHWGHIMGQNREMMGECKGQDLQNEPADRSSVRAGPC